MSSIQNTLCKEVLAQQISIDIAREDAEMLISVTEVLADTTELNQSQVESVLGNLHYEQEQSVAPNKTKFTLKPGNIRIGIYIVCGLLAFSAFKSAEVDELQAENQYDSRMQNTKVDFLVAISYLRGEFGLVYQRYFEKNQHYPSSVEELESYISYAPNKTGTSPQVSEYTILPDGRIQMKLVESFGYHRWMQLTPQVIEQPLRQSVGFDCVSNAEQGLLRNNEWCSHSTRKSPPS